MENSIKGGVAACVPSFVSSGFNAKSSREVTFQASVDGTEQLYIELLPDNFDVQKKHHLIIGLHGHGSDRRQFAEDARPECAAFRDIAIKYQMIAVTPDYRAATSWMGPKAEADLIQIIAEIKARYAIEKVFVVGASMGGTSASTFAALHPDRVDGVVSMNGHCNHLEYEKFQDLIADSFGGSKILIPHEYKKRSAEYWPENLTMPIALTVGGRDTSVPPDSALRLAAILKKMDRKVMLINRPDQGHDTDLKDATAAMEFVVTTALGL